MKARASSQSKATLLAQHVRAGKVYRREDLAPYSTSVDRELRQLVDQGALHKLAQGLYYKPKKNVFGEVPPDENELLAAFLKDKNFLSFNPSVYNSLRLGTTQLYNKTVVYNHKRHGEFVLERRRYEFRMKPRFPRPHQVTPEYLLVDMLNNLDDLAEDRGSILAAAQRKLASFDRQKLQKSLEQYGSAATKRLMKRWQTAEQQGSAA
ncbi:hypothetical protein SAMN05192560_1519 [Methylobacillus rhizosphaerae]|uniref:Transcriptional regulator, AbiEi antitoxin, Type IV TA system n=1 Tax=Methylobacillus rhizosphaerae TaxID=551994 RepID=A0A238ZW89_9PROT|nr:hypothetical protein [Methylobacillus rhizosphaerae]SNR87509.1 hypothetical protein SAMN05192560_1519 [Methylobacillus rhizosphaerae]